jgi:hypothetical protein
MAEPAAWVEPTRFASHAYREMGAKRPMLLAIGTHQPTEQSALANSSTRWM